MRKLRATAVALSALLTLAPTNPMFAIETTPRTTSPAVSTLPKNPLSSPTCGPQLQSGVWQQTPAGEKRYRKLEGRDADAFLEKLRGGNPQWRIIGQEARAALAARGFKPAAGIEGETVVIQIEKRKQNAAVIKAPSALARLMNFFLPTVHAQDDVAYVSEGVLWTSSWDDGDPATWEGVMGTYEYTYGNYGEGAAQFRNDTDDPVASLTWTNGYVTQPGTMSGAEAYHHGVGKLLACAAGGCFGSGLTCAFLGPFSMNCLLLRCGIATATCIVGAYVELAATGVRCGPNRRFICHQDQ